MKNVQTFLAAYHFGTFLKYNTWWFYKTQSRSSNNSKSKNEHQPIFFSPPRIRRESTRASVTRNSSIMCSVAMHARKQSGRKSRMLYSLIWLPMLHVPKKFLTRKKVRPSVRVGAITWAPEFASRARNFRELSLFFIVYDVNSCRYEYSSLGHGR